MLWGIGRPHLRQHVLPHRALDAASTVGWARTQKGRKIQGKEVPWDTVCLQTSGANVFTTNFQHFWSHKNQSERASSAVVGHAASRPFIFEDWSGKWRPTPYSLLEMPTHRTEMDGP